MKKRPCRIGATALAGAALALAIASGSASAAIDDRAADPVVATGAELPQLAGADPARVVAFEWAGKWRQVPVQIDERAEVDLRSLYPFASGGFVPDASLVTEVYTDADTLTGPDPDPSFDAGDELALMASDTGKRFRVGAMPKGTRGNAVELAVSDPIGGGQGYAYLFESDGRLDPGAGKKYVDYRFRLEAGAYDEANYKAAYSFQDGPNPEDSTVSTPYYSTRSVDRWVDRELRITADGSSGADILDQDKAQFFPGYCGRSVETFSGISDQGQSEGSFVINKSGPVRALRSYIGANSGPFTNREHVYYERRQDINTYLRVHPIPNVMQFIDYSPEASGMTYRNELNPGGVVVDGEQDALVPGVPEDAVSGGYSWEQVSGAQGTVSIVTSMRHDFPEISVTNYYLDEDEPGGGAETQCDGDAFAYGSSGAWINSPLPNTDPTRSEPARNLTSSRSFYYDGPAAGGAATAQRREAQAANPLQVAARAVAPKQARLKLKLRTPKGEVAPSKSAKLRVSVRNVGGTDARRLKVCVRAPRRAIGGAGCDRLGALKPGKRAKVKRALDVKPGAKPGKVKLRVTAKAKGAKRAKRAAALRIG